MRKGFPHGEAHKWVSAVLKCPPFLSHLPGKLLRSMEKGCPRDERSEWKTGFHPQVPRGQCSL